MQLSLRIQFYFKGYWVIATKSQTNERRKLIERKKERKKEKMKERKMDRIKERIKEGKHDQSSKERKQRSRKKMHRMKGRYIFFFIESLKERKQD